MPKKLDMMPSTSPMARHTHALKMRRVRMRLLFRVYSMVARVIANRHTACTAPAVSAKRALIALNICLPTTPPTAAPMASGVPTFRSTLLSPARMDLVTE